jgi:hypothetical protein
MTYICDICETIISSSKNIIKHKNTDKCKYIKNILDKRDKINNEKYNNMKTENDSLKQDILLIKENNIKLNDENKEFQFKIKFLQDKCDEYRKIVEYSTSNRFNIKNRDNKENIVSDTTFQIDINVNNKQLNKTKYKDIPEDIVKKDIQSLKLKDNYQLEYREDDGFINITNLCKAGGKHFKNWNQNDKTKRFLQVLSTAAGIPATSLIKLGTGHKIGNNNSSETWAHPQVAINIAQWISPEFDVLVSKWVYEIMLTGKVDIRDNKTTEELDIMNKENKLLKNRIKLLESKVLQKQPRETFDNSKNVIYIVTTEYKEAQGHYKIGKTQDLQKRLSTYNTTDKHEVIYYTSCGDKETMDILEKLIHKKLNSKRVEPNKEWFESEDDGEDLIKIIEDCKKILCE